LTLQIGSFLEWDYEYIVLLRNVGLSQQSIQPGKRLKPITVVISYFFYFSQTPNHSTRTLSMNLLAHITFSEGLTLAGVYLFGVVSGAVATWMVRNGWFQKNR